MSKLSRAQRDIITQAAAEGGLVVTEALDRKVVEQVVWHKFCQSAEQEDGSVLLTATEAGKAVIADAANPAPQKPADTPAEPAPPTAVTPSDPKGKLGAMVALLRRPGGASLKVLVAATGWQAHSVRGAMSGSLKKKLGLAISSEKVDGQRIYRIAPTDAQ
jgi:hypothetical protein